MAFTLRITFSGLCLFVPEPAEGSTTTGRMHVLMPAMHGHQHHGADRHVAAVSYDAGHLVQGGPAMGVPALASLAGHEIVPVSGAAADLHLCSHIVDLLDITGRSVDPDHLGADLGQGLMSRFTLGAGSLTRVSPGVCWEWRPGELRPIAHRAEWEMEMQGDSLTLAASPIGGGGGSRPLGTLYPRNGVISLDVLHETTQDLPPDPMPVAHQPVPMPGDSPPHFAAYYRLFGERVPTVLPRYWGPLSEAPELPDPCAFLPPDMGGTPYTCLVARVGP